MDNDEIMSYDEIFRDNLYKGELDTRVKGILIKNLKPFHNHPFKPYQGERLQGLITSIKELGVILPLIVRPVDSYVFEILSGHNRAMASKLAGFKVVPCIVKEGLTEEEANLIVTESNLIQRSFVDLSYSERALVLKRHYDVIKEQTGGELNSPEIKRKFTYIKEIEQLYQACNSVKGLSQVATEKLRPTDKVGLEYALSKDSVARYLRLNELIPALMQRLDNKEISFISAVTLSYIGKEEQEVVEMEIYLNRYRVTIAKAKQLRMYSEAKNLDEKRIKAILSGEQSIRLTSNVKIKLKSEVIVRFFQQDQKEDEIQSVIEKALEMYFKR